MNIFERQKISRRSC